MKKLAIIGGIAALIGIIVFAVGMTMLNWDFKNFDDTEYIYKKSEFSPEGVEKLNIDIEDKNLTLKRGGESILIEYYDSEFETFSAAKEGGEVSLNQRIIKKRNFWNSPVNCSYLYKITVTLPEDLLLDFGLNAKDAGVSVTGGKYNSVDFINSDCDIDFYGFEAQNINLKGKDLRGEVELCKVQGIFIDLSDSYLSFESTTSDSVAAKFSDSNFNAENMTAKSLELNISDGNADIENSSFSSVTLKATDGNVNFEIDSPLLALEFSDCNVNGEIIGDKEDYFIDCKAQDSYCNIESGNYGALKTLYLRADDSKINIKFVRED